MKTSHLTSILAALFCLPSAALMAATPYALFAPGQEPADIAALSETLAPKHPELVQVVKTPEAALKSDAKVLVPWSIPSPVAD